ncbi:MAG: general secretion pathway protein GspB [Nitrospirae bacterium]|nr:general secretion pathway protein GspB [Nitrospirota bacterium]
MSFILDALKKLEQKRQRGSVPDLMTVHVPFPQEPKKRLIWPYFVLGALILNAIILTAWLHPWESIKQNVAAKSVSIQQQKSISAEPSRQSINNRPSYATKRNTDSESAGADKMSLPRTEKPVKEVQQTLQIPAKTIHQNSAPDSKTPPGINIQETSSGKTSGQQLSKDDYSPSTLQPSDTGKTIAGKAVTELGDLPSAIQSELTPLSIFGHIYSDSPSARMVNINGQILREGETVRKNLRIEEITETGVIFSYQGTRFRIRAF